MKSFIAALALSASASATFVQAPGFPCPDTEDNKCQGLQARGFDWTGLTPGSVFSVYENFSFRGWTRKSDFTAGPTKHHGKIIEGTARADKRSSPTIGIMPQPGFDRFSVSTIDLITQVTGDLEFIYDMPGGKTCRHRTRCSSRGSTVKNTQCGGATNVTVTFPNQDRWQKTCIFAIKKLNFDCLPPKPPVSKPATSTTLRTTTKSSTSSSSSSPSSSSSLPPVTTPQGTTTKTTTPVLATPKTRPVSTTITTTKATTVETTFLSTSTIFTTSVQTVTSCSDAPGCQGTSSVVVVTATVPLTTTICPVTETLTTSVEIEETSTFFETEIETETPAPEPSTSSAEEVASSELPVITSTTTTSAEEEEPVVTSVEEEEEEEETTTAQLPATTSTAPPPPPIDCPSVVPSCLNTWMFSLGCKDNTDTNCYCPDSIFVKNIFSCIYAHGETDDIVQEATLFFQGLCAKHVPENPDIATGAETVTQVLTVTATPPPLPAYTTIVVEATTVVPCTTDDGAVIPSSSTTLVVSTQVTVPQVELSTSDDDAVVVPAPTTPVPIETEDVFPTGADVFPTAEAPETVVAPPPTGTGGLFPSETPTVPIAAAPRSGAAAVGLALAVAVGVAVAL